MPRDLYAGTTGGDVRALQRLLNFHLTPPRWAPLAVDGIFGPKTKARVTGFQGLNRIAADGIVGLQTRRALLDAQPGYFNARVAPESYAVQSPAGSRGVAGRGLLATDPPLFQLTQAVPAAPPVQPPGPTPLKQRTVQVQLGQQVNVNPWSLQPLVITGQFTWLFRRNGAADVLITAGGQFALNQQIGPRPSGRWSGQGFLQFGPVGLVKFGNFDLLNPYVAMMLQYNALKPAGAGLGLGNQASYTLWSQPDPKNPKQDRQNISIFVNGQVAANTDLTTGETSAPSGQFLGGVIFTYDVR